MLYGESLAMHAVFLNLRLTTTTCLKSQPLNPEEEFWDKNKRLNRPVSPHLTIYKFQITSVLSITHRATGLALSGLTSAFAIGLFFILII